MNDRQHNGNGRTAEHATPLDPKTLPIRRPGQSNMITLFGSGRHHYRNGAKQKTVAQLTGQNVGAPFNPAVDR